MESLQPSDVPRHAEDPASQSAPPQDQMPAAKGEPALKSLFPISALREHLYSQRVVEITGHLPDPRNLVIIRRAAARKQLARLHADRIRRYRQTRSESHSSQTEEGS